MTRLPSGYGSTNEERPGRLIEPRLGDTRGCATADSKTSLAQDESRCGALRTKHGQAHRTAKAEYVRFYGLRICRLQEVRFSRAFLTTGLAKARLRLLADAPGRRLS